MRHILHQDCRLSQNDLVPFLTTEPEMNLFSGASLTYAISVLSEEHSGHKTTHKGILLDCKGWELLSGTKTTCVEAFLSEDGQSAYSKMAVDREIY